MSATPPHTNCNRNNGLSQSDGVLFRHSNEQQVESTVQTSNRHEEAADIVCTSRSSERGSRTNGRTNEIGSEAREGEIDSERDTVISRRHLVRQVTFGVAGVGVQTDFTPVNLPDSVLQEHQQHTDDDQQQSGRNGLMMRETEERWCRRMFQSLDSAFVCYGLTGAVLVAFGTIVLYLVAIDDDAVQSTSRAENASQLWIVGPIFICSGVLVCIKAFTHIYNRLHPERIRHHSVRGAFLTSDSRPSLNRQQSLPPPNYSAALSAPVPMGVLEIDDKLPDARSDVDSESLARVTINFEPPPPTYDEAITVVRHEAEAQCPSPAQRSASTQPTDQSTDTST